MNCLKYLDLLCNDQCNIRLNTSNFLFNSKFKILILEINIWSQKIMPKMTLWHYLNKKTLVSYNFSVLMIINLTYSVS